MRKYFLQGWTVFATAMLLSACGGGGGGIANQQISLATGPNVAPVSVDAGMGTINSPFVTIQLCSPGSSTQCVTIDHILVDTGSTGLRVMASLLSTLTLPAATDTNSNALYACETFADGYSYGPVKQADLRIASEIANNITLHVIDDSLQPNPPNNVPTSCSNGAISINSIGSFGANGVLGIGSFREDCGIGCTDFMNPLPGWYYTCASIPCSSVAVPLTAQLHNPVYDMAADNNGAVLQFLSVASAGAPKVDGALIFGINTQSNNQLGSTPIVGLDPATARFTVTYKGTQYLNSLFDSGSNGNFFDDSSLTQCTTLTGFYCPSAVQALSATWTSATNSSVSGAIDFNVANAESLTNNQPTFVAFANIAGCLTCANNSLSGTFDWGMPFFYGRSVYVAIEGQSTAAGVGPFIAFK